MNKLIKLSDTHYIVVDDSEIKEDWVVDTNDANFIFKITSDYIKDNGHYDWKKYKLKITHSTQPLEFSTSHINTRKYHFDKIKPLSLSEVEELINGYNVHKMAVKYCSNHYKQQDWEENYNNYCEGFKAHQELVKDKFILTKDEISTIIEKARTLIENNNEFEVEDILGSSYGTYGIRQKYSDEQITQSLLPKTEWDCVIDEQGKIKLL